MWRSACLLFVLLWATANPASADETCTVLYDVDASFSVSNTDLGKGNTVAKGLRGTMVIEFEQDRKGRIEDGTVNVLHFSTYVEFRVDSVVNVQTNVHYFAPTCNGETRPAWRRPTDDGFPNVCGYRGNRSPIATGSLDVSAGTIEWASCNAPPGYWGRSRRDYPISSRSTGPGCLNNLHAVGNVVCEGRTLCKIGRLKPGDNPQSNVWNQPLIHGPPGSDHSVAIARDASRISTPLSKADDGRLSYEIPNDAPSRTWISWTATWNPNSKYTTCEEPKNRKSSNKKAKD